MVGFCRAECRALRAAAVRGCGAAAGLLRVLLLGLLVAPISDGLAQSPWQPWQFRPMQPSNARGAPPWQPAPYQAGQPGQQPDVGTAPADGQFSPGQMQPPGMQPAMPQAQWPQGQYPQPQMPPGQAPIGFPQQPFNAATLGQQYPGVQFPGNQPPGNQYQGSQYPPAPYQGGQYAPPQHAPQPYSPYGQRNTAGILMPRLEVELADDRPYVQENVLVRLRVISSGNLA